MVAGIRPLAAVECELTPPVTERVADAVWARPLLFLLEPVAVLADEGADLLNVCEQALPLFLVECLLAAPVRTIIRLLGDLSRIHPGNPIVLDLGSSKVEILGAMQSLPVRFDPLGGHPMCGKEKSGMAAADPELFRQRPFVFTRLERTSARACHVAEQIAQAVGATPRWMDAETHDRWVAATSHLPYLVSSALASATPVEAAPLAGPGFQSTSRLAAQPPALMLDVLSTNRDNVLAGLRRFRTCLDRLESLLETDNLSDLQSALAEGAAAREAVLKS